MSGRFLEPTDRLRRGGSSITRWRVVRSPPSPPGRRRHRSGRPATARPAPWPTAPTRDHHVEVGEEPAAERVDGDPVLEWTRARGVGPAGLEVLDVAFLGPGRDRVQGSEHVVGGPVLGERHFEQPFELQDRPRSRLPQPTGQRPAPLRRDRVDGPRASTDAVFLGAGIPMLDELLGLLVQLARCPGPHPLHAALHLLRQLVGAPVLDGQQAEDGVRRRGQRRGS